MPILTETARGLACYVRITTVGLLIMVLCCGLLLHGCAKSSPAPPKGRVIVVGIDAGTWDIILPMVRAGQLPNFKRLIKEGSRGECSSRRKMYSPVLWTTIATGKKREKHGITNFLGFSRDKSKVLPVTSNMRRVKAFWNILSENKKSVDVIGWFVTWPAEKIRGRMVTDHAWPVYPKRLGIKAGIEGEEEVALPGRTYPTDLLETIEKFHIKSEDITEAQLDKLGIGKKSLSEGIYYSEVKLNDEAAHQYATDMTSFALAQGFLKQKNQDVLAVYYNGTDLFAHMMWQSFRIYRYLEYGANPEFVDPRIRSMGRAKGSLVNPMIRQHYVKGRILERYYMLVDGFIGAHLAEMSEADSLIVVSDHGFSENTSKEKVILPDGSYTNPSVWHAIKGIVILYGPRFKKGYHINKSSIADITPTLLYLAGCRVGKDMDGRILEEAFVPGSLEQFPPQYIDTYETGESTGDLAPEEMVDEEAVLRRLRELGYI